MTFERKRVMTGRVYKDKMDKSVVVEVRRRVADRRYGKIVTKRADQSTEVVIENGKVTGDSIEFTVKQTGGRGGGGGGGGGAATETVVTYKAKVTGNKMEGTQERAGSTRGPSPFAATKE